MERLTSGLRHQYLYGLAVDSGDPNTIIVSSWCGPGPAYVVEDAESFVYRKSDEEENWKAISKGLPEPGGTTITTLVANPKVAGEFYAVNNHGIFVSIDSGISWKRLDIEWSKEYYSESPRGFAVASNWNVLIANRGRI